MRVLYERMVEDWSTLERLGDGILNCKHLRELGQRFEILERSSKLIEEFNETFYEKCEKEYDNQSKLVSINPDEYLISSCFDDIYKQEVKSMLDSYEALAVNIPSDIKNDYQRYLTNNLKQIKDIFEIRLNQSARKIKDETNLERFYKNKVNDLTELLKNQQNIEETKKNIDKNFNKHNETFYLKLETNYPNDNELLTSLVFNYNNVIKLLSGNHVFTIAPWSITPQEFNDFLIKNKSKNYKENLMNESITNRQSYPLKSYDQCVIFEESNFEYLYKCLV